jgi:O-antigen ligase
MAPEESMSSRTLTWQFAFGFFERSPIIGNGLGSFYGYATMMNSPLLFTHNFYLFILTEFGVVGLTLLTIWFFLFGYAFVGFWSRHTDEDARILSAGIFAGLFVIAITMFFRSFSLTDPTFWGFAGLASAFLKTHSPAGDSGG